MRHWITDSPPPLCIECSHVRYGGYTGSSEICIHPKNLREPSLVDGSVRLKYHPLDLRLDESDNGCGRAGRWFERRPPSLLRRFFSWVGIITISGCTFVGHERVDDWPALKVSLHVVPTNVMRDHCVKYTPPLMNPEACAEFDLRAGTCNVWIADGPNNTAQVEHELLHCVGYDHPGGGTLRKALDDYRRTP